MTGPQQGWVLPPLCEEVAPAFQLRKSKEQMPLWRRQVYTEFQSITVITDPAESLRNHITVTRQLGRFSAEDQQPKPPSHRTHGHSQTKGGASSNGDPEEINAADH